MTFEVLALICALSAPDCTPETARVVEKIGEGTSEIACQRWGTLSLPRGVEIGPGEYPKIMCVRRRKP